MSSSDIVYTNGDTVLSNVPKGLTTILVKSSCLYFRSENSFRDYAFINAKDSIESCYFEANSKLKNISSYSFYQCSKLSLIDLSNCNSLTEIGDYAFYQCTSLKTIEFPNSLIYIRQYSFDSSGLEKVLIPENVLEIGVRAFQYCKSLTTFEYAENAQITSITHHILVGCTKLTNLHIPRYLNTFYGNTFQGCDSLESFTIDENNGYFTLYDRGIFNLNKTEFYAFPPNIEGTYEIPDSVMILKTTAFVSSKLSYIVFPNKLHTIDSFCFYLSHIRELNLPSSLRLISASAFQDCQYLTKVVFPEGIETIAEEVFKDCTNLKTVVFPSTLKSLGGGVFTNCPLDNISFSNSSNLQFDKDNYWITDKSQTSFSQCLGEEESYIIPGSFEIIGVSAFYEKTKLTKIQFDDGSKLKTIGANAFSLCSNLQVFNFPTSLETIGKNAFRNCTSLQKADFSNHFNLTLIDESAFENCISMISILFPEQTETSSNLISIGKRAFYNSSHVQTLALGDCIKEIGESCFQYCSAIEIIEIPKTCQTIDQSAFSNCESLKECRFSEKSPIEELSSFLFNNCYQLSEIKFPPQLTVIGSYSLANTSITNFTVPSSVKKLAYASLQNCQKLTTLTINSDSVLETIEGDVFVGCTQFAEITESCDNFKLWNKALFNNNMTELIILPPASQVIYFSFPETLEKICSSSFQNVQSLEVVFIPTSVATIGSSAFRNCRKLRYINIPDSVKTIGNNAFEGCKSLQCGLSIGNRTEENTKLLLETAKLPSVCLSECRNTCNNFNIHIIPRILLFSISLIFSTF